MIDVLQSSTSNTIEKWQTKRYHPQKATVRDAKWWNNDCEKLKSTKTTTLNQFRGSRTNPYLQSHFKSMSRRKEISFKNQLYANVRETIHWTNALWNVLRGCRGTSVYLRIYPIIHGIHILNIY